MEQLFMIFPERMRKALLRAELSIERLQEIRLRVGRPVLLRYDGTEYGLTKDGHLTDSVDSAGMCPLEEELSQVLEYASGYSVYAFYEEIRQGFFTIVGGHRIGVAGKVVMDASGVQEVRHISFLNVRVSHQIIGCAEPVLPYLLQDGLCHTLIISPPGCGKTTLLRDLIRIISNGSRQLPGKTVGVVDERSELAGCCRGVPQNDIGMRTDVLDGCRKAEGMQMLLRAMAPEVIAVDEIGNYEDIRAIEMTLNSGCKLLATVHGSSIDEIRKKPLLERLIKEHVFERYIILQKETAGKIGKVREIYDERGTCLYQRQRSVC